MDSDFEAKLKVLHEEYNKNLPSKIEELERLWEDLNQQWNHETLTTLHRKCHSLHGSAKIYGFDTVGKIAADLESIASSFFGNNNLSIQQKKSFINLMNELKKTTPNLTPPIKINVPTKHATHKISFLITKDTAWATSFISQMGMFGYEIKHFERTDLFIKSIHQDSPDISALFVAMDMLTNQLENALVKVNIPIIFISISGEFSLRLKAVRLGGQAFFVRPFSIEDLTSRLDYFLKSEENEAYRILIIDDQTEVANYYAAVLKQANMITQIVTQPQTIDKVLHDFKPDILLMDLNMPDCNGFELASIVRQQSTYESLPIIFLSDEENKQKQSAAMEPGGDDFVGKSGQPDDLIFIVKNRANRYKILRKMMVYDHLTSIFNHTFILQQLELELKKALRSHNTLSVVMLDLDHFKHVNDTYGHLFGDQVLRNLSLMMHNRLRSGDLIGRYGGEEFIIIFPNTSMESAKLVIEGLQKNALELTFSVQNTVFNVTFSAGVACYPDCSSSSALIEAADTALYYAKKNGRNRVEITHSSNVL